MVVHKAFCLDHTHAIEKKRLLKSTEMINPLVCDSPVVEPLHVLVLLVGASHAPADRDEVDVEANDDSVQDAIHNGFDRVVAVACEPINKETKVEDGEVKSRVVVVHVSNTSHDNKRKVVQEPSSQRIQGCVVNVVDFLLREVVNTSLPSKDVPNDDQASNTKRGSRTPVDEWVAEKEVLDDVIAPTAHSKTNMEERPLPPLGSKVILLVRIGNQSVVGGHHGDVQVNKVVEERRLVNTSLGRGELIVPVSLNIPVGVGVARVVLLGASNLDLLETPLRQVHVAGSEITAKNLMLETESGGESSDLATVTRGRVANNLDLPVVLFVTNSQVTVAGNLLVASCDGSSNVVGVQVAPGLSMDKSNNRVVANESEIALGAVVLLPTVRVKEPVVVSVLVVVASNLLLLGTLRIGLDVRVKKTTTIAHVLDGCARTNCNL
jgi:hypothetical protein